MLNGYFLARALHVPIPLPYFFLIVPLALFVMMVPVSINAIGVRENIWAFFFVTFGVPAAAGVAVAWLDYGLVILQALVGGAVYAWGRRRRGRRSRAGDRAMRILLLAPHPFFQQRGTPIAEKMLLQVLTAAGHEVEVLTFPEGEDPGASPAAASTAPPLPPGRAACGPASRRRSWSATPGCSGKPCA